jgi:hypothetical protein
MNLELFSIVPQFLVDIIRYFDIRLIIVEYTTFAGDFEGLILLALAHQLCVMISGEQRQTLGMLISN